MVGSRGHWKDKLSANDSRLNLFAAIASLAGLVLAAGGLAAGAGYLFLALLASEAVTPLSSVTTVASLAALGLGLGGLLIRHGRRAWRGEPDAPFRPPRAGWLIVAFVAAAAIGQAVLSFDLAPRLLFPPFHVLAGALPATIVFVFVGRRLGRATGQRQIVGQVASGVVIGGPAAIALVGLAALALAVALGLVVAMTPGGADTLQSLLSNLQDPAWLQDPDNLFSLILTPAGLAGAFLLLVVVSPLVEEMLKPIGVLFISRRPGQAEAFLWGLAGASGFAMTEGMLNSAADLGAWLPVVLMRIGTSLMHCLAGGLVGLGWYFLRAARRPVGAVGLYLAAVALHGAWNALTLGIAGLSLALPTIGEVFAGLGSMLLLGALGLLIVVCTIALALLVRWLSASLPDEADAGPAAESLEAVEAA